MDINLQLKKIYKPYLKEAKKLAVKEPGAFSYPMLMHCFEAYTEAKMKLLVVGKESYNWYDKLAPEVTLETILNCYKTFHLAIDYYNSPFWRFTYDLEKKLAGSENSPAFMWTNICKLDYFKNSPPAELIKENPSLFGFDLLPDEVEILKPDVVVFLTHWNNEYGNQFERVFKGLTYDTLIKDCLYTCNHPKLPQKTFMTWHPNSLQFRSMFTPVLNMIVKNCK